MDRQVCGVILTACVVVAMCGCGSSGLATVPVTGTVLYNGSPVDGASVTFMPGDATNAATGKTDAQGRFTLSTAAAGKSGAVVGQHLVSISKIEASDYQLPDPELLKSDPTMLTKMMVGRAKPPENELPVKYANSQTSGLTATVEARGTNDFTFELTD